jgi:hypothetical protein
MRLTGALANQDPLQAQAAADALASLRAGTIEQALRSRNPEFF